MLGSPGTRRTASPRQRTGRDAPDGQRHPGQATGTAGRLRWGKADAMHEVGSGQGSLPSRRFGATAGPALRGDAPLSPWPAKGVVDGLGRLYGFPIPGCNKLQEIMGLLDNPLIRRTLVPQ